MVLNEAEKYSGGGYNWNGNGVSHDLVLNNQTFLKKTLTGTYCSGFTFSVAFETLKKLDLLPDSIGPKLKRFQNVWYGIPKESIENQCVLALQEMQWGREIALGEAQEGDFVQFWRNNNTGHSVIFIDWVRDEAFNIKGITYLSSQKHTNGIGVRTESIGGEQKNINPKRIYVGRIVNENRN